MVAPRIGLTAGHCVSKSAVITVHAATVGGSKKVVTVDRFWTDPAVLEYHDHKVHTDSSDIAILVLAEPLPMPAYARFARTPIEHSVQATGIRNAPTTLQAMGITLRPATSSRRYYASTGFAAPGDSGSPVFVDEGEPIVVGVLAGGSPGREIFARVDVVAHKLEELIASTSTPVVLNAAPKAWPPVLMKPIPAKPAKPQPTVPPLPPPNMRWI